MPTVRIINDDDSIASTLTSSTASDAPRRRRQGVRRRDVHLQTDDRDKEKENGLKTRPLHRQRPIDNIATWVSRRMSVRSLTTRKSRTAFPAYRDTDSESYYSAAYTETDDEGLADSYAAFCRAFTAGHPEYSYRRHEHRSHGESYRERRSPLSSGEDLPEEKAEGPFSPLQTPQDRALDPPAHSTAEGASSWDAVRGHGLSPLAVRASDEDHDPHLVQFSTLGAYGYAPLPPPPISPPPRILTPAIYAETQRAAAQERQWTHSQMGRQTEKDSQCGRRGKGFRDWWRGIACW